MFPLIHMIMNVYTISNLWLKASGEVIGSSIIVTRQASGSLRGTANIQTELRSCYLIIRNYRKQNRYSLLLLNYTSSYLCYASSSGQGHGKMLYVKETKRKGATRRECMLASYTHMYELHLKMLSSSSRFETTSVSSLSGWA